MGLLQNKVGMLVTDTTVKGKSCLISLVAFSDVINSWVDKRRAVDVVYLDFSKVFDTTYHSILVIKHRKCEMDVLTVRRIEN